MGHESALRGHLCRAGARQGRSTLMSATCWWPAAFSHDYCRRCALAEQPRSIRRVVARRPAGLPPCHTAGHMAVVAATPVFLLRSSRRPCQLTSTTISSRRRLSSRTMPGIRNAVGASAGRHKPGHILPAINALCGL